MYSHTPHVFASSTPGPALPTPRTGSQRSSLLALAIVVGIFATVAGLWVADIQHRTDEANAEAAAAMVSSVAQRVNGGAPMPGGSQVEAVAIALRDERQLHAAVSTPVVTTVDPSASSGLDADAAYLVDVGGELACLVLRDGRATAHADGHDVTAGGTPSALAPSFDCASLQDA